MTIFITGGLGFIGSYVTRKLAQRGVRAVVLCHSTPSEANIAQRGAAVTLVQGNITSFEELLALIRRHNVTHIIHLASATSYATEGEPLPALMVNIMGFGNILEAARRTGVQRVVYGSSVAVNGDQRIYGERPVTEDDPPNPVTLYGCSKVLNEFMARQYTDRFGLDTRGLRIAHTFGHGRKRNNGEWADTFASSPATDKYQVDIPYEAQSKAPFIYVKDVAEYLVRLVLAASLSKPVYVSGGHTASCQELGGIVQEFIPQATYTYGHLDYPHVYMAANAALVRDTTYHLRSLRAGVRDHIDEARRYASLAPLSEKVENPSQ